MTTHKPKGSWFYFFIVILLVLMGCGKGESRPIQEQFGSNAWYFMGLSSMQKGMEEEAVGYFKKGIKKSEGFFAQKCLEELIHFSSQSEKKSIAQEMYNRFPTTENLTRLCQGLLEKEDYSQIVSLVTKSKLTPSSELTYLYLVALSKRGKSNFAGELEDWFFSEKITKYHKKYYEDFGESLISGLMSEKVIKMMEVRLSVYDRDYGKAFKTLAEILQTHEEPKQWILYQPEEMLSDIGKSFLFGSTRFVEIAQFLELVLQGADKNTPDFTPFYLNFYIARLYDKGLGTGNRKAIDSFEAAMVAAPTPANYDNALWYYLSTQLKISIPAAEAALKEYGSSIHDALYYSDFFDTLILRYFTSQDWSGILRAYLLIREYADLETLSRYAYLCGRLIQLELVDLDDFSKEKLKPLLQSKDLDLDSLDKEELVEQISHELFKAAYSAGGDLYYRILATAQLGYAPEVIDQSIYQSKILKEFNENKNLTVLMEGFMAFDLPERIYHLWQENRREISLTLAQKAASYLSLYGTDLYAAQGLRLMSNALFYADSQTTEEMYRLAYPRLYAEEISQVAQKYGLPEYLIYGLVRSESFFDAGISSHAGAVGLAQLMPTTAADVARKLKIQEYDLTDPHTSVEFGIFYLSELIGRLDNSIIEALYSYNAGITNVRNWKKYFPDLPEDLIIELIPFTETRNYGKKIVSASAVYGNLYYDKTHQQVVEEIMFE